MTWSSNTRRSLGEFSLLIESLHVQITLKGRGLVPLCQLAYANTQRKTLVNILQNVAKHLPTKLVQEVMQLPPSVHLFFPLCLFSQLTFDLWVKVMTKAHLGLKVKMRSVHPGTRKMSLIGIGPTTLTFNPLQAMVMTYSHAKVQGQRSVGSDVRVETNGLTKVIALPPSLRLF